MKDNRDEFWFPPHPRISGYIYFFHFQYIKNYATSINKKNLFVFCPGNDNSFGVEHCSCKNGSPTFIAKLSVLNWPVHLLSFSVIFFGIIAFILLGNKTAS